MLWSYTLPNKKGFIKTALEIPKILRRTKSTKLTTEGGASEAKRVEIGGALDHGTTTRMQILEDLTPALKALKTPLKIMILISKLSSK